MTTLKIMFIGQKKVGKTTLVRYICDNSQEIVQSNRPCSVYIIPGADTIDPDVLKIPIDQTRDIEIGAPGGFIDMDQVQSDKREIIDAKILNALKKKNTVFIFCFSLATVNLDTKRNGIHSVLKNQIKLFEMYFKRGGINIFKIITKKPIIFFNKFDLFVQNNHNKIKRYIEENNIHIDDNQNLVGVAQSIVEDKINEEKTAIHKFMRGFFIENRYFLTCANIEVQQNIEAFHKYQNNILKGIRTIIK
ncbi:MAG: hypothetical protein GF364_19440 [Candidatus Lokiarchaeota archaeon]|nr:hypothetical protein [Candidatus Lokiarchaeota archaeon]